MAGSTTFQCHAFKEVYHPRNGICGAAFRGDIVAVAEYIRANPESVSERDNGATPLIWAAYGDNATITKVLILSGADVNERVDGGWTATHAAATKSLAVLIELLENGADVNVQDERGYTPLSLASKFALDPENVRMLLKRSADPNVHAVDGSLALGGAAFYGRDEVVSLLIEYGAEINAMGIEGATALHWAVSGGRRSTVALLLASGATINAKDDAQKTPLDRAGEAIRKANWIGLEDRRIAKLLRKNGVEE